MNKKAILLKQEIVAAFMECEDGGDYLESGIKKFERKLDEILTSREEPSPQELYLQKAEEIAVRVEPTVCPNCGSDEWITVCNGCYHPLDKEN